MNTHIKKRGETMLTDLYMYEDLLSPTESYHRLSVFSFLSLVIIVNTFVTVSFFDLNAMFFRYRGQRD